jgi:NTE family protein
MAATTGLILMGGGARAAYQAGVLEGIAELLDRAGWPRERNPFPIVCGTSAGAINAAAYAAHCDDWAAAVTRIGELWRRIEPHEIYRTDLAGSLGNAAHWVGALLFGWLARTRPRSLFDNTPLRELLERSIDGDRLRRCLETDCLRALAITASSYTSGQQSPGTRAARRSTPGTGRSGSQRRPRWASSTCSPPAPSPSSSRRSPCPSAIGWSSSATARCASPRRSARRSISAPNGWW